MQVAISEGVHLSAYGSKELTNLAKRLARSYNIMELIDLASSLNMRASDLPCNNSGISREIVLFAHQRGLMDELILRLRMDGKL